jgi:hypothetical protein
MLAFVMESERSEPFMMRGRKSALVRKIRQKASEAPLTKVEAAGGAPWQRGPYTPPPLRHRLLSVHAPDHSESLSFDLLGGRFQCAPDITGAFWPVNRGVVRSLHSS